MHTIWNLDKLGTGMLLQSRSTQLFSQPNDGLGLAKQLLCFRPLTFQVSSFRPLALHVGDPRAQTLPFVLKLFRRIIASCATQQLAHCICLRVMAAFFLSACSAQLLIYDSSHSTWRQVGFEPCGAVKIKS